MEKGLIRWYHMEVMGGGGCHGHEGVKGVMREGDKGSRKGESETAIR